MSTETMMISHPTIEERRAKGRETRTRVPRSSHVGWTPATDRPDPVAVLEEQNLTRMPDLVPVRHGRMMVSPFTFYRGAAGIMAADLAATPTAGLEVQLCGDAHLSNFGVFGSPERTMIFDCNDFDETLPGPFEFDVKRLSASFAIAGRNNGFSKSDTNAAVIACVQAYRETMAEFATMRTMDIWYAHVSETDIMGAFDTVLSETSKSSSSKGKKAKKAAKSTEEDLRRARKRTMKARDKARTKDSMQALAKLGEVVDGRYRIVSDPPIVIPARELPEVAGVTAEELDQGIRNQFRFYRASLPPDRRHLLERFEIVDMARKVVGVGSVGTWAFILLLQGRDAEDPLFLQIKEATRSVLEGPLRRSRYRQHGQRVVEGQRLMQSSSDIYLGWGKSLDSTRHFYWRQLRDMKGSADVETMSTTMLPYYGRLCGISLARSHARSGDPVEIAGYLGGGDSFDKAIADFSERYADQNERDYEEFMAKIKSGQLEAVEGV
jgi:uncharacterized protein (DUF2252 family)